MIKRRFYKLENSNRDDASDSSVSSSDSEPEAVATEESEDEVEVDENDGSSTSSGYESEASSINEVDVDLSGLPSNEDDADNGNETPTLIESELPGNSTSGTLELQSDIPSMEDLLPADIPACVLKCKSVFKCRICPRVVCLNEETLRAHIKSKRHARSEKLLNEGRLKLMLNSNGVIENLDNPEEPESPPRITAFPLINHRRKNKSQQRSGQDAKRSNKNGKQRSTFQKRRSTKIDNKKRRKIE